MTASQNIRPQLQSLSSPVVSLMFHDITDHPLSSGFRQPTAQRYKHTTEQFRNYLDVVHQSQLPVGDVTSLRDRQTQVFFTFDDGGAAAMTAADQLERYNWRGLFFITTDLIGTTGFLNRDQIRELADRGHIIGSHSCSHPDVFRNLDRQSMLKEWSKSRDSLQQLMGRAVTFASVPGGDIDRATIQTASEAGLTDVFTSEPSPHRWQIETTTCYGRMMMVNSTRPNTLKRWLDFPKLGPLPERTVRATKSSVKRILGPAYQRMIERRRLQHHQQTAPQQHRSDTVVPARKAASRVVALINPNLHCRSTCAELIRAGVNLVGIVECQTRTAGLPVKNFRRLVKKQGLSRTASQVAARLAHMATHRNQDREIYRRLFNRQEIDRILSRWDGCTVTCESYSEDETLAAIRSLKPDILVVHSQSWVDRKVRELPSTGLVIGGHPGVTPHYRGSHSSFWAMLNEDHDRIGWTAFHIDKGVDTGDVIVQGRLEVNPNDSYMTLNWQGMNKIAAAQATAILEFDRTGKIARQPHSEIPDGSEFGLPGLGDYRRYLKNRAAA